MEEKRRQEKRRQEKNIRTKREEKRGVYKIGEGLREEKTRKGNRGDEKIEMTG